MLAEACQENFIPLLHALVCERHLSCCEGLLAYWDLLGLVSELVRVGLDRVDDLRSEL